jgi:hypothetical protein
LALVVVDINILDGITSMLYPRPFYLQFPQFKLSQTNCYGIRLPVFAFFPDSRTVYSNVPQCDRQVDCRVTASRKRPSEVDLADLQDYNDLQEKVWRDVDRMLKFSRKESQIFAEQLRRKRMKSLCTQLESLLPATPAKVITTLTRADTVFQGFILYVQKRVMVNLPKLFSVS